MHTITQVIFPLNVTIRRKVSILIPAIIMLMVPTFVHHQMITGTLVNATLLIVAFTLGPMEAMLLGFIPSLAALSGGLLPLLLAPVIPYIMVSNAIYIYLFTKLSHLNKFWALLTASVVKFGFLYVSSHYLLAKLLQPTILNKAVVMMSWPQIITALTGGFLAIFFLKNTNRASDGC